ncbi:MAG: aminotransferase class IV [Bacteroidales bacterium]|nr:aminotransferase class IV [Bacteroidales bacterium]
MFDKKQILYNGQYISGGLAESFSVNRAFLYGDSIFETMFVSKGEIHFFEEHLNRLIQGMKVLKYVVPDKFTVFKDKLKDEILQLMFKNKLFKSARVRLTVFRKSGGLYTPVINEVDYIINVTDPGNEKYVLNNTGYLIDLYDEIKKPINKFSSYKIANSLIYTLAGVYKNERKSDDCLILNERGNIIETISSNIFLVINNKLITPPIEEGCINGIIRNQIINFAKLYEIICTERPVQQNDLLSADEVFLTNSINGIKWVVAYKDKRYFKKMSNFFTNKLNEQFY